MEPSVAFTISQKILATLGKEWMPRNELFAIVGQVIPEDEAILAYGQNFKDGETQSRSVAVERGRYFLILVRCVSLVRNLKIEERGRGKEYRLTEG